MPVRFLAAGRSVPAFTPFQVPGLKLWLRASAITGLSAAASVSAWSDSSGYGNNAVQAVGVNQPTYQVVSGKPCVRFDGATSFMSIATDPGFSGSTGDTFFFVLKTTTPSGNGIFFSTTSDIQLAQVETSRFDHYVGSASNFGRFGYTAMTPQVVSFVYDGTNPTTLNRLAPMRLNGVNQSITVGGTIPASRGAGTGTEMGRYKTNGAVWWAGDLYDVLWYNHPLSVGQLSLVEHFLGNQDGVTVS